MPGEYDYGTGDPNLESQTDNARRDAANQDILQSINEAVQRDPVLRAWVQAHQGRELSEADRDEFTALMQARGYRLPANTEVNDAGGITPIDHTTRNRILAAAMAAPLLFPGSGAGAAGATGATGSGAGAAGGSGGLAGLAGPGYTVPSATLGTSGGIGGAAVPTTISGLTTPGVGTVATSPGVTAGGTGGAVAGSTKSSFWNRLLGESTTDKVLNGIDLAGNVIGNEIQSRQTDKAVQAQIDAANRALELQRNVYLQQRSDLMPYADMGRGAIGDMGRMTGTSPISAPTREYFADAPAGPQTSGVTGPRGAAPPHDGNPNNAPVTGQAVPRNSLASLAGGGTVNMLSPDGQPARVPQAQVQAALQAGGRLA